MSERRVGYLIAVSLLVSIFLTGCALTPLITKEEKEESLIILIRKARRISLNLQADEIKKSGRITLLAGKVEISADSFSLNGERVVLEEGRGKRIATLYLFKEIAIPLNLAAKEARRTNSGAISLSGSVEIKGTHFSLRANQAIVDQRERKITIELE